MFAAIAGLTAGIIHVWSGPDHLAAIAPLSLRRVGRAWMPGLRWGLGHSIGVGLVGLLSLWLRDLLPLNRISSWGERIVGLTLIGIGLWALRKAFRVHAHEHSHEGDQHTHMHAHSHRLAHEHSATHEHHTHAALGIGVLHGLAGSSHFFGVLPILAFPSRLEAITYLATFGIGTVVSMATFSSLIGWVAGWRAAGTMRAYRVLLSISASIALAVGVFWLYTAKDAGASEQTAPTAPAAAKSPSPL